MLHFYSGHALQNPSGVDTIVRRGRTRNDGEAKRQAGVILVTSAAPNEGKTTMALSIARAYAQAGSRVLLIDCDLRRPSVHRQIGQEPDKGIMDYLTGEVGGKTLKDIVVEDQVKGLELLVGARRSDTATDQLLAGPAFETLIAASRRVFDVVILDAPPVGPVIDGIYLARRADAIVFVVRWANTPQPEIRAAITALSDVIGPDVEIVPVLNSSVISGRQYYGKYASYYSEL